jgi:hypothetical protein
MKRIALLNQISNSQREFREAFTQDCETTIFLILNLIQDFLRLSIKLSRFSLCTLLLGISCLFTFFQLNQCLLIFLLCELKLWRHMTNLIIKLQTTTQVLSISLLL